MNPLPRMTWDEICTHEALRGRWVAMSDCSFDDATGRTTAGLVVRLDEAVPLQSAQLGVDLTVARAPEESCRAIGDSLDVIAGAGSVGDEAEDHARGGSEV